MTRILLTAAEAYPAFEDLVAQAQSEVCISMRIFDVATPLYGKNQEHRSWAELIAAKLAEGVSFDITLADFDPVARPALHRYAHQCFARLEDIGAGHPENFKARILMHPAQAGWLQRFIFGPLAYAKLREECARLNDLDPIIRAKQLATMPEFAKLVHGDPLRPRLWPAPPLYLATHHQKMAVIDETSLYIGGLDLNPRRYDDKGHDRRAQQTWHDVQVIKNGPIAQVARHHIRNMKAQTGGASVGPAPGLMRTLSQERRTLFPRLSPRAGTRELEAAHLRLINAAERYIYVETQFLRSSAIVTALEAAARRGVHLIAILPAAPEDAAFSSDIGLDTKFGEYLQAKALIRLRKAFGSQAFIGSPAQQKAKSGDRDTLQDAPIIYVHAKVIVSDETSAIVSSANLNGRSMRWDTETGVALEGEDAKRLFERCTHHWLGHIPEGEVTAKAWADLAAQNAKTPPAARAHFLLPHDTRPAQRLGRHIFGLPEEMV